MPCYHPLQAWHSKNINESGKRGITFKRPEAWDEEKPMNLPCGRCIGCKLEYSRKWAVRCMHESDMHEENCFLTLTYNEEKLPYDHSLDKTHFQKFMKRYRKYLKSRYPAKNDKRAKVRYYMCGEYGERTRRPHYHAIIFGQDFPDKILLNTRDGISLYTSETLSKIWGKGFCTIGAVTFESCAYVSRYITKKITGDQAEEHYRAVDEETGETWQLQPEYVAMSRKPGIGQEWFKKYRTDVYPKDYLTIRGKKQKPPKYYDQLLERDFPFEFDEIKQERELKAMEYDPGESMLVRLHVKEVCKKSQISLLKERDL